MSDDDRLSRIEQRLAYLEGRLQERDARRRSEPPPARDDALAIFKRHGQNVDAILARYPECKVEMDAERARFDDELRHARR